MSAIEVGGVTHELNEQGRAREGSAAELKRQTRQRRAHKADAGAHAVDRSRTASRTQEAADANLIGRAPVKRWQRSYTLPHLPAPAGFVLCYIARHRNRHGDDAGLIAALQEGWEFARKEDFPREYLPTQRLADHGTVIGNDTTVLMKLPEELKAQRDAYYNGQRDAATKAVTRPKPGLPEATRAMPLVEDRNDVQVQMQPMRVRRRSEADA